MLIITQNSKIVFLEVICAFGAIWRYTDKSLKSELLDTCMIQIYQSQWERQDEVRHNHACKLCEDSNSFCPK